MARADLLATAALISLQIAASNGEIILKGAGGTFPLPLYERWIGEYHIESGVRVAYDPIGSGGGVREFLNKRVDFGATDSYLSNIELVNAPGEVIHVPTCVGAVAVTYHLPGKPGLRFTAQALSDIFLGKIHNWSESQLAKLNPDVHLPDLEITVIHRSDASGTTYIFSDFLAQVSEEWNQRIGRARSIRWPVGLGVDGNGNVSRLLRKIPGSIGYAEFTTAHRSDLPAASIRNANGSFVSPDTESISAAADVELPADARLMITNSPAEDAYPISSFTYLLVYREQGYDGRPRVRAESLAKFLGWAVSHGQEFTTEMMYAPLPDAARMRALQIIRKLRYEGKPLSIPALAPQRRAP